MKFFFKSQRGFIMRDFQVSDSLGIISTRLQGLWFISSWYFSISFHASLQALGEPGIQKIKTLLQIPARALDWIVDVPIFFELIWWKSDENPSIFFSSNGSIASGVISLPVNPVPPVLIMTSTLFVLIQLSIHSRILSILSGIILNLTKRKID